MNIYRTDDHTPAIESKRREVWDPWNGFFQTGVEPRLSSENY